MGKILDFNSFKKNKLLVEILPTEQVIDIRFFDEQNNYIIAMLPELREELIGKDWAFEHGILVVDEEIFKVKEVLVKRGTRLVVEEFSPILHNIKL